MESTTTVESLNVGFILMELFGGLALFLFGMDQMTDALKRIAGSGLKKLLAQLTSNRFMGVFTGLFVTAVIQSSSVTTVMVVGFIAAGLMTLRQSVGIILGADIGTTITAQIVAFKVTHYALGLVAIGFVFFFAGTRKRVQQYGAMLMGLGLIFFGMEVMSEATRPLRTYQPFIDMMRNLDNPLIGILIGTIFTGIIQSSSATMGIIIVLASQGFVTLEAGIALAFGANIGTCVTALLAAIGQPREAVQAAVVHILFKVVGVVIWVGFIDQLAALVRFISPSAPELEGIARLAAETPRQIANAHTVFNVANTLLFIWFVDPLVHLMNRLIPERPLMRTRGVQPRYLDPLLLDTPELALDRVRLELGRLGEYALRMMEAALPAVFDGNEDDLERLSDMDDDVDTLYGAIVTYLGRLSQENLTGRYAALLSQYMTIANHLENIGDMVETNLVEAGSERIKYNVEMSASTREKLLALHEKVLWSIETILDALNKGDLSLADEVISAKMVINRLADEAEEHLANRLVAQAPNRLHTFSIETEIIEYLKRVYYFAKRIAKAMIELEEVYAEAG
ncbi:MAG: Na/Pi cotransporter family protein [Chloroflexi bacterium]|nr:MAG: Na/Pi cotransporter family protein [Chloroflexota bacterium]